MYAWIYHSDSIDIGGTLNHQIKQMNYHFFIFFFFWGCKSSSCSSPRDLFHSLFHRANKQKRKEPENQKNQFKDGITMEKKNWE